MSFQLSVLKILAGQPDGRATVARVKEYLEIFYTSGPEWTARMKALAAKAPDLDIFTQKLVERAPGEWMITDKGRALLEELERLRTQPVAEPDPTAHAYEEPPPAAAAVAAPQAALPARQPERRRKRAARRDRARARKSG